MMPQRKKLNIGLACVIIPGWCITLALAHYPLVGMAPQANWHKFVSGVVHPIIGFDRLALLIAFGLIVAFLRDRNMAGDLSIASTTAGTLMFLAVGSFPMTELVISASIALTGFLVMRDRVVKLPAVVALALGFGLLHSFAFGPTVIGSKPPLAVAYLLGSAFVQMGVVFGTDFVRRLWIARDIVALKLRLSGAFAPGADLLYHLNMSKA